MLFSTEKRWMFLKTVTQHRRPQMSGWGQIQTNSWMRLLQISMWWFSETQTITTNFRTKSTTAKTSTGLWDPSDQNTWIHTVWLMTLKDVHVNVQLDRNWAQIESPPASRRGHDHNTWAAGKHREASDDWQTFIHSFNLFRVQPS